MSFMSLMQKIGHDIKIVFEDVVKYLPNAAVLAEVIFPHSQAALAGVLNAVNLIQQTVVTVEQKFAAAGNPTGTGPQKLAQVLSIVTPAVTSLLQQEKVVADATQITNIVNAVVAILNVQAAPAA